MSSAPALATSPVSGSGFVRRAVPPRTTARALLLVTATVALAGMLVDLQVPAAHHRHLDIPACWPDLVAGLSAAAAGAAILRRRQHPVGWLLAGFGLWWVGDAAAGSWLCYATLHEPARPGASTAFWIYQRLGSGLLLLLPLLLLLHPDGRLPTSRWRWPAVVSLASTALLPVLLAVVRSSAVEDAAGAATAAELRRLDLDPFTLPLPDGVWSVLLRAAYVLVPLSLVVPFGLVVARYRSATGLRRTRMRWLLWAGVVDVLVMLSTAVLPDAVTAYALPACVGVTSAAVAVALVRPDLVDVDLLLGNTVVYGALLALSFVVDVVVLGVAGSLLDTHLTGEQGLLLSVFAVSVLYAPLRYRLWGLVRRMAYGERDDPYRVVSRLAERLETTDTADEQLLEVAGAVARAFRSPYVGVEVWQADGARLLAEHGPRPEALEPIPISYRGEEIGRLMLPSGSRPALRPADTRLLADVVRQAAAATRAARLAEELQGSRERIVTAVEDERRRLRNELHDGLGPTLAAVASRIDTARLVGRKDPDDADRMLGRAREDITGLLAEVRRLVYGLRPPALDDVGLVGAVRQQAESVRRPGLAVDVEVPEPLGALPAAVEVAAYRIVAEALANVARHAAARTCAVTLRREGSHLVVEVVDDGVGIAPDVAAGVGLVSLRERAAELGGQCLVTSAPEGGARVRAVLPLPDDEGHPHG